MFTQTVSTSRLDVGHDGDAVVESRSSQRRMCTTHTILVADDDADFLDYAAWLLRGNGYHVLTAPDGGAVFDMIATTMPDLLVLDCNMPVMDGLDVCRRLRQDDTTAELPILFLTGLTSNEQKVAGFEAGGQDYICKPIHEAELLARVKSHLELSASRRMLRYRQALLEDVVQVKCDKLEAVRAGQASILPETLEVHEDQLAVRFLPANEAGGDFYDIVKLSDHEMGFFVADVSGHDLSVPYITGGLKALCATFLSEALQPTETMMLMNAALRRFLTKDRYVTACYVRYDTVQKRIEVVSAGHPAALHMTRDGNTREMDAVGDVLGMFDRVAFDSDGLSISPGDRLFLYTDGVIEAYPDSDGRLGRRRWGMQCLAEALQRCWDRSIRNTVEYVIDELLELRNGTLEDDVVLIGIEL
jgi:sigma-B regulation protein RsbU (phosphoserine phosphatase)